MHKHFFLLVSLIVCCMLPLYAQDSADYGKYKDHPDYTEGIIKEPDGTIIKGLIKNSKPERHYRKIIFVHADGKRKKYAPARLVSFRLGKSIYHSDGKRFLELVEEGERADLYRIRSKQSGYVPSGHLPYRPYGGPPQRVHRNDSPEITYFVRKKGEKKFREVGKAGFHKAFAKYFVDYNTPLI